MVYGQHESYVQAKVITEVLKVQTCDKLSVRRDMTQQNTLETSNTHISVSHKEGEGAVTGRTSCTG